MSDVTAYGALVVLIPIVVTCFILAVREMGHGHRAQSTSER